MNFQTISISPQDTIRLGEKIAKLLKGGETIELVSDLGGGKTVFVKGLAKGLGYSGAIISPTFTVSRIYSIKKSLELHHFDFYRLPKKDVVAYELAETAGNPSIITIVEWASNIGLAGLPFTLRIRLKIIDQNKRKIIIKPLCTVGNNIIRKLVK